MAAGDAIELIDIVLVITVGVLKAKNRKKFSFKASGLLVLNFNVLEIGTLNQSILGRETAERT